MRWIDTALDRGLVVRRRKKPDHQPVRIRNVQMVSIDTSIDDLTAFRRQSMCLRGHDFQVIPA